MSNTNFNKEIVEGVEYVYDAEWTKSLEAKSHWEYYWYQQKLMEGLVAPGADRILELGVGSGFAANYLRSRGHDVTTFDIDEEKQPDIIGNVVTYDFAERFDHLMAFEILEHIPYSEFEKIIRKLPKFVNRYAFISLPRNERVLFKVDLRLPRIPPIKYEKRTLKKKITCAAHHWEMDYGTHTVKEVEALFHEAGLQIARRLTCDYIRFYALEIADNDSTAQDSRNV